MLLRKPRVGVLQASDLQAHLRLDSLEILGRINGLLVDNWLDVAHKSVHHLINVQTVAYLKFGGNFARAAEGLINRYCIHYMPLLPLQTHLATVTA